MHFLPSAILERATARIHASLRPGGWVVFARFGDAEPLPRALAALRSVRNGARVMTTPEAEALVRAAGFTDVRTLPPDAWPPGTLTVGMRAK